MWDAFTRRVQVRSTSGEPFERRELTAAFLLAENPETERSRGFFVSGLEQKVSWSSRAPRVFSGSRESGWGAVGKVGFPIAVHRTAAKLSKSLLNTTLAVNAAVPTAARSGVSNSGRGAATRSNGVTF
jgi:hypothetical protein